MEGSLGVRREEEEKLEEQINLFKTGSKLFDLILLDTALKSLPKEFQDFPQVILQSNRNGLIFNCKL